LEEGLGDRIVELATTLMGSMCWLQMMVEPGTTGEVRRPKERSHEPEPDPWEVEAVAEELLFVHTEVLVEALRDWSGRGKES
jgi:hypothetical protein